MTTFIIVTEYQAFLVAIKQGYQSAQLKTAFAINHKMIQFYWQLGKLILEKQTKSTWGTGFLKQLSKDLHNDLPSVAVLESKLSKNLRIISP